MWEIQKLHKTLEEVRGLTAWLDIHVRIILKCILRKKDLRKTKLSASGKDPVVGYCQQLFFVKSINILTNLSIVSI
jgi:hypothetical protein